MSTTSNTKASMELTPVSKVPESTMSSKAKYEKEAI